MEQHEKFLPIGTVVSLKKSKSLVMITGYCVKSGDKAYDYACCLFPDGILNFKDIIVFNHDRIKEIYYMGYKDENYKKINKYLIKEAKGENNE